MSQSGKKANDISSFARWVGEQAESPGALLPLTHLTKGISARKIIENEKIEPQDCKVFNEKLSYFFYGRPAYRISDSDVIKLEASCPICFIFGADLIKRAREINAFDTGAFAKRLFSHVIDPDFDLSDFSLGQDHSLPNRLIDKVFGTQETYLRGDRSQIKEPSVIAQPYELEARSYLELILSPGRNEPDDRICAIEVTFADPIPVPDQLEAVVVPHTLFDGNNKAPWLAALADANVDILPYDFCPGRPPEHYHTLVELAVMNYYRKKGVL
jgi:hypothetical protein